VSKYLYYSTTLEILNCGSCGIPFAMPANVHRNHKNDGDFFWCPNGDKISYHESEADKLKKELAQKKRTLESYKANLTHTQDQLEATERSRAALKGVVTRQKKRIKNGVCPVDGCQRHFENLQAHIEEKHPGYLSHEE